MLLLLLACSGPWADDQGPSDSATSDSALDSALDNGDSAPDLDAAGPYGVSASSETVSASCEMELERFTAEGVASPPLVILSHGFARDRANMVELGAHLASWGFDVAVPTLCKLKLTDTDHPQNAQDLTALAAALGGAPIYVGYSAGGLASALAAAQDASARAWVGLDPVDNESLGLAAAGAVPQLGLFAEPSGCNAENNGTAWFQGGEALRITQANHCDFEGPSDALCTAFCASGSTTPDPLRREVVWTLSTAAVLGLDGDSQLLDGWWRPGGEGYEAFLAEGRISPI